jgi:hypothetical protein
MPQQTSSQMPTARSSRVGVEEDREAVRLVADMGQDPDF